MYAVEHYAAVRHFVFIEGKSRREAAGNLGRCRLALAQRLAQTLERQIEAGTALEAPARSLPIAEQVNHCFRRARDRHSNALDLIHFNSRTNVRLGKPDVNAGVKLGQWSGGEVLSRGGVKPGHWIG